MPDDVTPPLAAEVISAEIAEPLADLMFALAAPSRLQILDCLSNGPLSVSEIVERVAMEQSAVSHQLRVLRDHGALRVQRHGRHRLYRLSTPHIAELIARGRDHLHSAGDAQADADGRRASR